MDERNWPESHVFVKIPYGSGQSVTACGGIRSTPPTCSISSAMGAFIKHNQKYPEQDCNQEGESTQCNGHRDPSMDKPVVSLPRKSRGTSAHTKLFQICFIRKQNKTEKT
jgi:hypothetical protein